MFMGIEQKIRHRFVGGGLMLLLAGAPFVGGCSDDKSKAGSKATTKSTASDSIPRVYESPDGKVEVGGGGDTVEIETPEGKSLLINGRLPDEFPKGFPIIDGANFQTSSVQPKKDSTLQTTRYFIDLDAPAVFDRYIAELPAAGYKLVDQKRVDDGPAGFDASISFEGQGDLVNQSGIVVISFNKEKVQVSITLTLAK